MPTYQLPNQEGSEALRDGNMKPLKNKFNLDHGSLYGFLEQLADRVRSSGWTDINQIPPDLKDIDVAVDLMTGHGNIILGRHLRQWTELCRPGLDANVPMHLRLPFQVSTGDCRPPEG